MRKLTLLIEDDVYEGLHRVAGRGQIGRFISDKVRPHLAASNQQAMRTASDSAYGALAQYARKSATPEGIASARRAYLRERCARKLGNAGRD
jgi:hypothetical protein